AVVLLDEVEKAHPDVFNMLLQIMEEGRLTDSFGRHIDFKNVILIMTSNIGAEMIKGGQQFGFGKRDDVQNYEKMKSTLMNEAEKYFRPEFINRLDEIIVFRPLTKDDLFDIIEIELDKVRERLQAKSIELELDKKAKEFLIDKGFNPDFGARPLRRAISSYIEDPLAESLLSRDFQSGEKITVTHKEDAENLYFQSQPIPKDKGPDDSGDDGDSPEPSPDRPTEEPAATS
ncbi:MAG: AAA family ATPase, partial [Phycisphaerales bacterium]